MFTPENINKLLQDAISRLNSNAPCSVPGKNENSSNGANGNGNKINITPSQALVIGGILGGVLSVDSVLVDKDQTVQIVLSGTLKQKSELEKMLDQIGSMPFDEVVKAMMGRL